MFTDSQQQQYAALTSSAGYSKLPLRCMLILQGEDRSKFLNNFCTADIAKLQVGQVTELFVLDSRGKTLAFGHVANLSDQLLVTTANGSQSNELRQHLDKYVIREDVTFVDETNSQSSFFVAGELAT